MRNLNDFIGKALMIAAVAMFGSCGTEPQTAASDTLLTVSPTGTVNVAAEGGTVEFTIESAEGKWSYTIENGMWLKEKSKTATALVLEAEANTMPDQRKATVRFSETASPIRREAVISQSGVAIEAAADMLDVIFRSDGTAGDISAAAKQITTVAGSAMYTRYSNIYKRYIGQFNHSPGGTASGGYFKMDYDADQTFKNRLADGHTLETVFMLDVDSPLPDSEIKMFCSHQSGGSGFLIGNAARGNSIIFLPYVGGQYIFTNSGVVPQRNKYYHVVGVWDKQAGKTRIYVDGVLKAEENAAGDFKFPSSGSNWFCVGADPSGASAANTAWKGDVVLARIYDGALDSGEVSELWEKADSFKPAAGDISITGAALTPKNVMVGSAYTIAGEGFAAGDKLKIAHISGNGVEYLLDASVDGGSLSATIPDGFLSGTYRMFVVRGDKTFDLGFTALTVKTSPTALPQIIAHRGYWKSGAPQNSVASLVRAQEINVYGSELDVWITTDGVVVLNHDPEIENIRIESAAYNQLKDIRLANGEPIPTLEDYLEQAKLKPSVKLIVEIKSHSLSQGGATNNDRVAQAVVEKVAAAQMTDYVEYIAFGQDVCKKLIELQPGAPVGYLNGDLAPAAAFAMGITCLDYKPAVFAEKTSWIAEAQQLGMVVNVWTVNTESDIQEMINQGVDFITTDYPELALEIVERNK